MMMNPARTHIALLALTIMAASCAMSPEAQDCGPQERDIKPGELDIIICQNPRPQVCTREYDPVCATLSDGSKKTYATGCTSCSDEEVISYRSGSCS
jgi:hypothetical protein